MINILQILQPSYIGWIWIILFCLNIIYGIQITKRIPSNQKSTVFIASSAVMLMCTIVFYCLSILFFVQYTNLSSLSNDDLYRLHNFIGNEICYNLLFASTALFFFCHLKIIDQQKK
ncbi:MAG: hypothetical protein ACRCUP_06545 [Mycoplasmatales bacterium]